MARNPSLDRRIEDLGHAMVAMAETVDENLRTVLLAMTTDPAVTDGLALRDLTPLEARVMSSSAMLFGLQGPVAHDLRWAMAMIRLAKDYERVADLCRALMKRVLTLTNSLHEEALHEMTAVMHSILKLHAVLLDPARPAFQIPSIDTARLQQARIEVGRGIEQIEERAAEALLRGEGSPDELRELVLATRHLLRIADQLARMPGEIMRFHAASGDHPPERVDLD